MRVLKWSLFSLCAHAHIQFKTPTPDLIKQPLRAYQRASLDWMTYVEPHGVGWILADDSGLGKKLEMISFLAHLASTASNWGPHVVVAPTVSLFAWLKEFTVSCPGLKTFLYYGSSNDRRQLRKVRALVQV